MAKFQQLSTFSVTGAITLFCLANVAYAFETQAECEGAGGTWNTTSSTCTIDAEGTAVTMTVHNPQTISVIPLTRTNDATAVLPGKDVYLYYSPDRPSDFTMAAWGVVTNGRFSVNITNDFGSIMDGTASMFGADPVITDDFGAAVTWPAFVKWETDAAGKKYDGVEITGTKRYEVLPASFDVELYNIDSVSGNTTTSMIDNNHGNGFKKIIWEGTGKQVTGFDPNDTNNFITKVGSIQVADKLGAGGTGGTQNVTVYNWYNADNVHQKLKVADHYIGVIAIPEMNETAAANAQAGTYYAGIKLTVTAEET